MLRRAEEVLQRAVERAPEIGVRLGEGIGAFRHRATFGAEIHHRQPRIRRSAQESAMRHRHAGIGIGAAIAHGSHRLRLGRDPQHPRGIESGAERALLLHLVGDHHQPRIGLRRERAIAGQPLRIPRLHHQSVRQRPDRPAEIHQPRALLGDEQRRIDLPRAARHARQQLREGDQPGLDALDPDRAQHGERDLDIAAHRPIGAGRAERRFIQVGEDDGHDSVSAAGGSCCPPPRSW